MHLFKDTTQTIQTQIYIATKSMGVMHDLEERKIQFVNRITKSYVGLIAMQMYCTICVKFNQVKMAFT